MPAVPLRIEPLEPLDERLRAGFAAIRSEVGVSPDFPEDVQAEAAAAAAAGPTATPDEDLRDLPFVTIDPPGSRDLDQAMALEARAEGGWIVHYAIADVGAFVAPGGALDTEARRRGVTVYLPDGKAPLHPTVLSEGAASLLPDEDRPAVVWRIAVDADGEVADVLVRRATVRSRRAFTYQEVQHILDGGAADTGAADELAPLRELGMAREHRQQARGGLDLRLPEQSVVVRGDGTYGLEYRAPLPVEGWNAQVSLLTGECAAALMLDGGVGILRTMPPPDEETVARLRRHAAALEVPWPETSGYAEFLRTLDVTRPDQAALMVQSAKLARGAGYLAFTSRPTGDVAQSAVTAPYAHVTAPLRRLVDRFANELVVASCKGCEPPGWVLEALPDLPGLMETARHRERAADGMAVDLVEAAVLSGCTAATLEGVVVDLARGQAKVQLTEPAVVTSVPARALRLGDAVSVIVRAADLEKRSLHLEVTNADG